MYVGLFVLCVCAAYVHGHAYQKPEGNIPSIAVHFIYYYFNVHMYVCVCTCVYVHRHAHDTVRMWKSELWILVFFFVWDMMLLAYHCVKWAIWTVSFQDYLVSTSHLPTVLCWDCRCMSFCVQPYVSCKDPNSVQEACVTSTLPTEPSPQPSTLYFEKVSH